MNPVQPPAEPPRNVWPDAAPALPSETTSPNPALQGQIPAPPYDAALSPRRPKLRWWSVGRVRQIIFFLLSVLETLLIIRFFLKLLAANPDAFFTILIYGVTELFVAPFEGVFPSPQTSGSVLDFATLLAMIVYALLAWLTVGAIETVASRRPVRAT